MLSYKAWLDTRWRFLIGLCVLIVVAIGTVYDYLAVQRLLPLTRTIDGDGAIRARVREAIEIERTYRGFVWLQWFRQNLAQIGTLFAVLLGSGHLLSSGSSGAALFTLSLPVSRDRLVGVRAAVGLAELLALALLPSLAISALSPGIGQHYAVGDAVIHGASMFIAATVFFSLAFLLSTVFNDLWRPLLIACAIAFVLAVVELVVPDVGRYGIFRVMSGEMYFSAGRLPWIGWIVSAALSASLLYAAVVNMRRQDF